MLSELCMWLSLLHGILESVCIFSILNILNISSQSFLCGCSVLLCRRWKLASDCVPKRQGVPSFIQHKPRFWKLFCAFHEALNASGMHIPGIILKMIMERSLLQFTC